MDYSLNKIADNSVRFFLIMILVLSTVTKIIVFDNVYHTDPERVYQVDTPRYERPALSLLHEGTLAINPHDIDTSALQVAPAYPALIAASHYIFGLSNYPLILLQILISTFSIWLVYLIACKLWSQKTGLIAAALMALDPLQFFYAQVILTETLFTSLSLIFVLCCVYLIIDNKYQYKYAILLGLALAAATMVRPITYYLIFPIIIGILFYRKPIKLRGKHLIQVPLLILVSYFIVVGSWQVRNGQLVGSYIFTDNLSSLALKYKAAGVIALEKNISYEKAYEEIIKSIPTSYLSFNDRFETRKEKLFETLSSHKVNYLMLSLQNLPSLLFGPGFDDLGAYYVGDKQTQSDDIHSNTATTFIHKLEIKTRHSFLFLCLMSASIFYLFALYTFFFYGARKSVNSSGAVFAAHILMFGLIIYFIIISTGNTFSYSRIRVPLMPFFILYASYGLQLFIHNYNSTREKVGLDKSAVSI